jgi:hypothetical protein
MSDTEDFSNAKKLFDKRRKHHCIRLYGLNDPVNDHHYHDTRIWYPLEFITGISKEDVSKSNLNKKIVIFFFINKFFLSNLDKKGCDCDS